MPPEDAASASTDRIPEVVSPESAADYFEVMTRAVFQAGVRWKQIAEARSVTQAFPPVRPRPRRAIYDDSTSTRLCTPAFCACPKSVATIANARALVETERAFGGIPGVSALVRSLRSSGKGFQKALLVHGRDERRYFLFRVGEPVPRFETWVETIPGEHPRMREMVERARSLGRSSER